MVEANTALHNQSWEHRTEGDVISIVELALVAGAGASAPVMRHRRA
jgi:hypothetical protein